MSRNKLQVKVDDQVYILSGKDAGKTGKIIAAYPAKRRVIVEGVNIATRHVKPRSQHQQGGLIRQEMPVDVSNVMLVCPKCKRPSKVGRKYLENGDKVRYCKACDATVSVISKGKKA